MDWSAERLSFSTLTIDMRGALARFPRNALTLGRNTHGSRRVRPALASRTYTRRDIALHPALTVGSGLARLASPYDPLLDW